jgi:signal transduction histidine kinase
MRRPWQVWAAFAVAAAVILLALGWVTSVVLRLEEEGRQARRKAALEEKVRLALWRMESVAAPIVAREGARPYFSWQSFYPAGRAYTRMFARLESGDVLVPSPLLADSGEFVALHFQVGPDGRLTSPQVPEGNMRDIAESGYVEHSRVEAGAALLRRLDPAQIRERRLRHPGGGQDGAAVLRRPVPASPVPDPPLPSSPLAGSPASIQRQLNTNESIARLRAVQQAAGASLETAVRESQEGEVVQGAMQPVWLSEELALVRGVRIGDEEYVQGCLLVWPDLRQAMIDSVRDILPEADLVPLGPTAVADGKPGSLLQIDSAAGRDGRFPAAGGYSQQAPDAAWNASASGDGAARSFSDAPGATDDPRALASLPVRLVPGTLQPPGGAEESAVPLTLAIAWSALLAALLAAGLLLASAVSLGERRNAFVSAVTHELRTPLTTFRMYTEMLDEGMVGSEEQRRSYVSLLRSEAERLGHLVENVLAYARLERQRATGKTESVDLADLVELLVPRLSRRAAEASLELRFEPRPGASVRVRADRDAVERILFNLVDNACKYASSGPERVLHMEVTGPSVLLRDHGPGIPPDTARKLFRPFSRGAQDAAGGPPGVGLGLALSRRLAQRMGGDLTVCRNGPDGAEFCLTLPGTPG